MQATRRSGIANPRRAAWLVALALLPLGVAGCGAHRSSRGEALPPAAEPSVAPAVVGRPPGVLVALPAGSAPEGVIADPATGLVVVALHHPDRIALVDDRTWRIRVRGVDGSARHLVLAKPGGPVLLPAEDTNRLLQIGLPTGRVLRSTDLPRQPHNAAVVGAHYWVADELASAVSVVSRTGRLLRTMGGPVQPGGVAAAGGTVGVVDVCGARMYFYDAASDATEGSIPLGRGPTHVVAVGHDLAVAADTRGGALLLVDLPARRIVERLPMPGGPYGLAADPTRGDVYVTLTARNQLVSVHVTGRRLRVVRRTATVRQPNTVAVNPVTRCVFVAGVTDAQLQVLCPTSSK